MSAFDDWHWMAKESRAYYGMIADRLAEDMAHIKDKTARRKAAREAARSVLPNATETRIFVTGNVRSWRTILDQRASPHADAEIRRLAVAVLRTLRAEAPNLFGDYRIEACPNGGEMASTPYRKV
jgi:thymidylate synthase (FAD)